MMRSPTSPLAKPTAEPPTDWIRDNQQYLMTAIGQIRLLLEYFAQQSESSEPPTPPPSLAWPEPLLGTEAALDRLCRVLGLSPFERSVLLLCMGAELNRLFGILCAQIYGSGQTAAPTFGLALSILPAAHWSALRPEAPLRGWKLLEIAAGGELTNSPLRIDEQIAHYLMGVSSLDQRLQGIVRAGPADVPMLPNSHQTIAEQVAITGLARSPSPVVQLSGNDGVTRGAIAAAAAAKLNRQIYIVAAETLPTDLTQLNTVQCLCEREALLNEAVLVLECDRVPSSASGEGYFAQLNLTVDRFIETYRQPLLISSIDRRPQHQRPLLTYDVHPPTPAEQRQIWHRALGDTATDLNGSIDRLTDYFTLSAAAIQATCQKVQRLTAAPAEMSSPISLPHLLWTTCLSQARPRLGDLAQPIETLATLGDIVLPEKEKQVLKTITAHVRQRSKVYEAWGFSGKSRRGLGISALFAGASGTGKTMAAEIIAGELKLDLYRIDLSSVVSKYIGETEKNMRQVFDAAETGGAILLFDEADALFGKRSEVSDSHDRYANMEVAYLLQRIESYRGLAILTTNLKDSVDQAFLRRIRFVMQFPFPDAQQREEIWQRVFPQQTPTRDLHYRRLAKLNVAGGNIRNIAINAAFLAADEGSAVEMKHILLAAQSEYIKLERPLTDVEVRGWITK